MGNAASVSETRPPPPDCTFELEPGSPSPSARTVPAAIPAAGDAGAATTPQPLAGALDVRVARAAGGGASHSNALADDGLAFVIDSTGGDLSGATGHAQSDKGAAPPSLGAARRRRRAALEYRISSEADVLNRKRNLRRHAVRGVLLCHLTR